ncbi:Hypothetical protein, putative [Bodo saltans]|uniref:Uncharacterized protein n=1 Tax=Bodo saltans TaxID=75058 RepID=A0A0S4IZ15_BODSA|nr:Hypothetical protein, putative [Bodo saltans]|eukprot:CUG28067.1 Hypothetical protein, putative [Bodo saltans]
MPKPMLAVDVSYASPSSGNSDDVRKFVYDNAYNSAPLHSPSPIHRNGGGGGGGSSTTAPTAVANLSLTSSESFVLDRTSSMVLRSKGALGGGVGVDSGAAVIHVPASGVAPVPPLSTYMLQFARSLDSGCSTPCSDVQDGEVLIQEQHHDVNSHSGVRTDAEGCAVEGSATTTSRLESQDNNAVDEIGDYNHNTSNRRSRRESSEKMIHKNGYQQGERSISQGHGGSAFIATPPSASAMLGSSSPPVWSLAQQESNNGSPIPTVLVAHHHVSHHNSIVQMSLLEDDVTPPLYFRDEDD